MARYTGPVCKLCRREGKKLYLKGERCYSDKCSVVQRNYAPGQHGNSRKKLSEYGIHLREKQAARRYYGILELQFLKYFNMAAKKTGITGENLLQILESRLDNAVYRAGFASSRKEARQLVLHKHFNVNGKKVNIPSYLLKKGDIIEIDEKSRKSEKIKEILEINSSKVAPKWLNVEKNKYVAKVESLPLREDVDFEIQEQLIIEYYSK